MITQVSVNGAMRYQLSMITYLGRIIVIDSLEVAAVHR